MRVLQVIHGYPMRYNAGSEVYTQGLAQALAERHEVHVFTRQEDLFAPDYKLTRERDPDDARIALHIVNQPRSRDRYRHQGVDARFGQVLDAVRPDVVHIGHLNHLSTSLLQQAAARDVPIVFTLHDYWLMCPRGQFMQMSSADPDDPWAACDGQDDRKCAERCYSRYFSGAGDEHAADADYWTGWVGRRMEHVRQMAALVDRFIAPSRYLADRFQRDFALPAHKVSFLDYGFHRPRMAGRRRLPEPVFAFGYIGTHIPAKGIHVLLSAFGQVHGTARLRVFGRPRGETTPSLVALGQALPGDAAARIEWCPEYRNQEIIRDVFDRVDAVVVPSIWVENSPLVIHEALQARVPVITADVGGMAEYVHHEVNGLLFRHRDPISLAQQMQRLADDPSLARRLGERGYAQSASGDIPDMQAHALAVEQIYRELIDRQRGSTSRPGPWRITFDTNPDDCNLRCVMCEEHSPHSLLQVQRRAEGRPRRRMDVALIQQVLAESRGTPLREIIPSTMGEPLLYEEFDQILALCRDYGVKLNLTTNGTFPRLGAAEWARRIVPLASDVKISWNGATAQTAEQIMIGARFEHLLDNVRAFIAVRDEHAALGGNRCRVTFQLTFLETNVAELADMVRLAAQLGVDRVKGHHLWAHFDEIKDLSMRRSPESVARWNLAVRAARAAAQQHLLPSGGEVLLENIFELPVEASEDLAPGGACPFLGQEAWVSATGRFSPCCAPDAQRRTLGEFGDLPGRSLYEIWQSPAYRHLESSYRQHSLCKGCNMRKPVEEA